jgi:hypothetical protein
MDLVRKNASLIPSWPLGLILAVALALVAGCKRQPYGCVPVSGKLTYEDGSVIPADKIRIKFFPLVPVIDPKSPPRFGAALVDPKTGNFDSAMTFQPKDGLIAGEHKVVIECFSGAGRELRRDLFPPEYCDSQKTPLKVDTSKLPFELKVPKPKGDSRSR